LRCLPNVRGRFDWTVRFDPCGSDGKPIRLLEKPPRSTKSDEGPHFSLPRGKRIYLLACLFLGAISAGASSQYPELEFGTSIIDRLATPKTRLDAVREIVLAEDEARGKKDWQERSIKTFADYHQDIKLTRCAQPGDEAPLYLLTYRANFDAISRYRREEPKRHELLYPETRREREAIERLVGSREAKEAAEPGIFWEPPAKPLENRVLVFLNTEGRMVWPFKRNNFTDGGVLHDVNGDGVLERLELGNMRVYDYSEGEPNINVQLLEVRTVTASPEPLLRLVLNWHHSELDLSLRWNWDLRDINSDGIQEIVIGPPTENGIEVKAVFRWDAETGRYTGPAGGRDTHFVMLDLDADRWEQLKAIKASGGMSYAPVPLVSRDEAFFHREPYVHATLAGLSHTELFDFMWGGREEHPPSPPPAGVRPRKGEKPRREFEAPENLSQLEPRAAALHLAQANRTEQHRADFELFLLDDVSPPEIEWVSTSQKSRLGLASLQLNDSAAPWWRMRFNYDTHPPVTLYPYGNLNHEWRRGELTPERAAWLAETLWWLTRLRSVPQTAEAVDMENELVRRDGFGPPPTEFGFRVLDRAGEALLHYPTNLPLRRCWQWVGPYDRQVCRTLAFTLWRDVLGDFDESGQETNASEALRYFTEASRQAFPDDVPARPLAQAVTAVGDAGDARALSRIETIAGEMPPPDERELAWREAKAKWEEVKTWTEKTDWKEHRARRDAFESASEEMSGDLAWQLRNRLPRVPRQIALAENREALAEHASQPGTDLAIWALRRLEEKDPEAAVAALEAVYFRDPSKWRERILNYRARDDIEAAKELYLALPAEERIPLMEHLFRRVSDEAEGAEWIDPLFEVIGSDQVPARTRVVCLQLLVPRTKPLKYPDREIAERLEAILKRELAKDAAETKLSLLEDLLRALAAREQTEGIFQYADTIWTRSQEEHLESSAFYALVHIARSAQLGEEERERLWKHFDPARSEVRAKRVNYVGYVYTADLREARDILARLATRGPDEAEPRDNRRDRPLIENGREHFARQLLAVWDEPNPTTRAQCLIVFGMQLGSVSFSISYPEPDDIALQEVRKSLEKMSPGEKNEVEAFLAFLEEDPAIQERIDGNHYAEGFLYKIRRTLP
jgi:hypothetical protein